MTLSISAGLSESASKRMVIDPAGFTPETTASTFPAYVSTGANSGVVFDAVRRRVVDPEVARHVDTSRRQANAALTPAVRRFMGHPSGDQFQKVAYDNTSVFFRRRCIGDLPMVGQE